MTVMGLWRKLAGLPFGNRLFSITMGRYIPYTGSMGAFVRELEPGRSVVELRDRRKVRNHLQSVHAVAMMNVSEFSSGLALLSGLPDSMRAILVGFSIEYTKKARGKLTAKAQVKVPESQEKKEYEVPVEVFDEAGDVVCRGKARWLVGPNKKK